jgi:hypothetical protein
VAQQKEDAVKLLKLAPLALMMTGLLATVACFGDDKDDTGLEETDTDADADADSDTDADADADIVYNNYDGTESFDYGFTQAAGTVNCHLAWGVTGTPLTPCNGCEFAFDLTMSYDAASSTDDGTCVHMATDGNWQYAYTTDYYGYGGMLLLGYAGNFYAWAYADFTGDQFSYETGYKDLDLTDYGYPCYFYTYWWEGAATVTM